MNILYRPFRHSKSTLFTAASMAFAVSASAQSAIPSAGSSAGATSPGSSTAPSLPSTGAAAPSSPGTGPAAAPNPSSPSPPPAGYAPYPNQQPPAGYAPYPNQQPPAGYAPYPNQQPPAGYAPYPNQQPPAGYAPYPNQQPPNSSPPGYAAPPGGVPAPAGYAPQPNPAAGAGRTVVELPLPQPRPELRVSLRYNIIDLLFGKVSGELEYAFAGPFSVVVGPEYIFGDPRQDHSLGISAKGAGIYGELGVWVEGPPLRGYFLKAHVAHRSVTFRSDVDELTVPQTLLGAMFGSQSVYAGWFTVSGGFGIAYDTQSEDRSLTFADPTSVGGRGRYVLPASGLLKNGVDLITQLSIGGSF